MTAFLAHIDWSEGCFQVEPYEQNSVVLDVGQVFVVSGVQNHIPVVPAPGLHLLRVEQTHFPPRLFGAGAVRVFWTQSDDETVNQLVFGLIYLIQKRLRLSTSTLDETLPFVIGAPELPVERVTENTSPPERQ